MKKLTGWVRTDDGKTWYHGNGDIVPWCWTDDMDKSCAEVRRSRIKCTDVMSGRQLTLF